RTETREKIQSVAAEIFSKRGFHNTGLRAIAADARLSIGSIYHYFKSKDDILLAILRRELATWKEFVADLERRELPVSKQIEAIVVQQINRIGKERDRSAVFLLGRLEHSATLKTNLVEVYEEMARYLERLLRTGIERKEIRPCNSTVVAYAILGIIESISTRIFFHNDKITGILRHEAPAELTQSLSKWLAIDPLPVNGR
ncbi:TetR/AcrR family transcriptional regulator, partial [Candidatus Acetothermia bacterium]|nr:TetR/AcrR family transcriptional regulator [Candidatus Acetothermia bacterium]